MTLKGAFSTPGWLPATELSSVLGTEDSHDFVRDFVGRAGRASQ